MGDDQQPGGASPNGARGFSPVSVASLRVDTVTAFDLYMQLKPGRPHVLYREKNLAFTEEAKERLKENNVTVLFIREDQMAEYRVYVEGNLGDILSDPELTVADKSQVLYDSAQGLVKEVLEDPRSGDLFRRTTGLVEHTVPFVLEQKGAFENLVKVTSYDYYTYTHSVNVCMFSIALGGHVGLDAERIVQLGNGALLHDVGKCMLDPAILNCPGKLRDDQWEMMKRHPVYGYTILKRQGIKDTVVLDVTRHHHEKLDGRGYPDGLRDEEITPCARISAIADIFDALTTRRSYKDAIGSFAALKLMKGETAEQLDAEIFGTFVRMMGGAGERLRASPRL